jgi:hypothetical protein
VQDGLVLPRFSLVYKPSAILLDSVPSGASVYLGGIKVGVTGDGVAFPSARGRREITLKKNGFVEDVFEIDLKGGETKVLPTRRLTSISAKEIADKEQEEKEREEEERKEREEEEADREEARALEREAESVYPESFWNMGVGYGGKSASITLKDKEGFCCFLFPLGIQWRVHRKWFFRAEYSLGLGKDSEPSELSIYGSSGKMITLHDLNVGFLNYIYERLRVGPEVGIQFSSYSLTGDSFSQAFYGISIGIDRLLKWDSGFGFAFKVRNYSNPVSLKGGFYALGAFTFGAVLEE